MQFLTILLGVEINRTRLQHKTLSVFAFSGLRRSTKQNDHDNSSSSLSLVSVISVLLFGDFTLGCCRSHSCSHSVLFVAGNPAHPTQRILLLQIIDRSCRQYILPLRLQSFWFYLGTLPSNWFPSNLVVWFNNFSHHTARSKLPILLSTPSLPVDLTQILTYSASKASGSILGLCLPIDFHRIWSCDLTTSAIIL